ncbi:unnamed protein product (mitochondrion) [Plasmodiophora brassicae]|uniref:Uncharacterized protein n=2 Tax=Plasmodiophora brassicae TaxID=37360 RepID=A0A3P3Y8H8_PLABS|nr:unnamed protein product [Plasmodiophora brassicae]
MRYHSTLGHSNLGLTAGPDRTCLARLLAVWLAWVAWRAFWSLVSSRAVVEGRHFLWSGVGSACAPDSWFAFGIGDQDKAKEAMAASTNAVKVVARYDDKENVDPETGLNVRCAGPLKKRKEARIPLATLSLTTTNAAGLPPLSSRSLR